MPFNPFKNAPSPQPRKPSPVPAAPAKEPVAQPAIPEETDSWESAWGSVGQDDAPAEEPVVEDGESEAPAAEPDAMAPAESEPEKDEADWFGGEPEAPALPLEAPSPAPVFPSAPEQGEPVQSAPAISLFEEPTPESEPAVKPSSSWLDHLEGLDDAGDLDWGDDDASRDDDAAASSASGDFWESSPDAEEEARPSAPEPSQRNAEPAPAQYDDFWGASSDDEEPPAPSAHKDAEPESASDDDFWGAAPDAGESQLQQDAVPSIDEKVDRLDAGANEDDDFWGTASNADEESAPPVAQSGSETNAASDDGFRSARSAPEENAVPKDRGAAEEPESDADDFWGPSAPVKKETEERTTPAASAPEDDFWGDAGESAQPVPEPEETPAPQSAAPSPKERDNDFWGEASPDDASEEDAQVAPPAAGGDFWGDSSDDGDEPVPAIVASTSPGFFDGPSLPVHLDDSEDDEAEETRAMPSIAPAKPGRDDFWGDDAGEPETPAVTPAARKDRFNEQEENEDDEPQPASKEDDPWGDAPAKRGPATKSASPAPSFDDEGDEQSSRHFAPLADIPFRLIAIILAAVLVLGAGGFGIAAWMRNRAIEKTKTENAALCSQLGDASRAWGIKAAQGKALKAKVPPAPSFACAPTGNAMRDSLTAVGNSDKALDNAIADAASAAWKPTAEALAKLKAKYPSASADTISSATLLSKQSPKTAADLKSMQSQAKALSDKAASEQKAVDAKKAADRAKADAEAKKKADEAARKAAEDAANAQSRQQSAPAPAYTPYAPAPKYTYVPKPAPAPVQSPNPPAPAPAPPKKASPSTPGGNSDAQM